MQRAILRDRDALVLATKDARRYGPFETQTLQPHRIFSASTIVGSERNASSTKFCIAAVYCVRRRERRAPMAEEVTMSNEALGWVWKHSPYRGVQRLLHIAVADVVNDLHGNEFWMTQSNLADKAGASRRTVGTWLAQAVEDGYLELVEDNTGRGKANRYRFEFPSMRESVRSVDTFEEDKVCNLCNKVCNPRTGKCAICAESVQSTRESVQSLPTETKGDQEIPMCVTQEKTNSPSYDDDFEILWKEYPRKLNKKGAYKAWLARLKGGATKEEMLQATVAYRSHCLAAKTDSQFILHPSTFLGPNDRYLDYLEGQEVLNTSGIIGHEELVSDERYARASCDSPEEEVGFDYDESDPF